MDKMLEAFEEHAYCWAASFTRSEEEYCDDEVNSAWLYFKAGAAWQAAQSAAVPVVGEVVAYLKADSTGKILWSEDCVCEDAVWAGEDSEFGEYSLPLIVQPATSISAAELDALRKDAERYRWIRDANNDPGGVIDTIPHPGMALYRAESELDGAIDAAIAGEKK